MLEIRNTIIPDCSKSTRLTPSTNIIETLVTPETYVLVSD